MINNIRDFSLSGYKNFISLFFFYLNNQNYLIEAPHHDIICNAIDALMLSEKEDNNLLINIAPRSGKTMLCAVYLIAYCAALSKGRCNILLASYSTKLARKSISESVAIIESDLFKKMFPATTINSFSDGVLSFKNGGFVYGVSPRSSTTGLGAGIRTSGKGCYGMIIVDDLVNSGDAFSASVRERANDWFFDSLMSRKNNKKYTPVICIAQRLHEDDLPAKILEKDGDKFKKIIIPTINEENKTSFWERMYPYQSMQDMKEINPFLYYTQYQQDPVPKGNGIFKESWFKYYDTLPYAVASSNIFVTADTAQKTAESNDYSVFQVWLHEGYGDDKKIYLIDQIRVKLEAPELLEEAKELVKKYNPSTFYIEDKSSGTGLIQQLQREQPFSGIKEIKRGAKDNKVVRARSASVFMAQGRVLFPKNKYFIDDLIKEILSFNEMMTHKHDDQVDALSDACNIIFNNGDIEFGTYNAFSLR